MTKLQPLPTYNPRYSHGPSPTYTVPTQFRIGASHTGSPLVRIPEIKGHLALLRMFAELKNEVAGLGSDSAPYIPVEGEKRWSWFVALAVERFDIWCHALKLEDAKRIFEEVMPPLDVIMVWHAYMLNPRWYAEDCLRIPSCAILKDLGPHFDEALLQFNGILSDHHHPSQLRVEFWRTKTALPFDALEGVRMLTKKTILCPQCRTQIQVDLMDANGQGYLQQKFSAHCPTLSCSVGDVTKEKLAVRKLAEDLVASTGNAAYLPGTLYETLSSGDTNIGSKVKEQLCKAGKSASGCHFPSSSPRYTEEVSIGIMKLANFSLVKMRSMMVINLNPPERLIRRIMDAYSDDKVYSVELVGAVLRQGSFVHKMHELGWTELGFFDGPADELALQHALARYHAFLDLLSSSPASFFVPTLDIDLVWHTHQLMTKKYASDCKRYVGRYIDHDDKVEGLRLSSAFDITCRAWKERFKVQYTHCGCPVPGDSIGERLLKLIKLYSPQPHLLPFDRPDLLLATHPSDHNAVRFIPQTQRARVINLALYARMGLKKRKAALKSPKKPVNRGPGSSPPGNPSSARLQRSTFTHDATPFLVPIPTYYAPGVVIGAADCVADGHSLQPAGGCGSCISGSTSGGGCGSGSASGCAGGIGSGSGDNGGGGSTCGGGGSNCGGGSGCGGGGGGGGCGGGS